MSVQIRKLKVKNYRGIIETEVDLPSTGVFHGDFLMGKTSIFEAISLALGVDYWISEMSLDSFYRGMVNFEEFVESEQIAIRLTLSGFDSKEHFSSFIGTGCESAMGYYNEEAKELNYDRKSQDDSLAVEIVFLAKIKGDQIETKRFLANKDTIECVDGGEAPYAKDLADPIGFFYIPFRSSNQRKWLEKELHESFYEVGQWRKQAKDYLDVFQNSHNDMIAFMDRIEQRKKEVKSDEELGEEVVAFVGEQVAKIAGATLKRPSNHASKNQLLESMRSVVEKAKFKELLQIIGANSYNMQGKCLLSGVINEVIGRIEKKKPCILFLDEPEAFFEEHFFWKRFIELVQESDYVNLIAATHDKDIVEYFPSESRIYIHNVFGNIAVLDEVLFNGLYE